MQGLPCPRMLRMPLEENLPVAADPPARSPACWSSGFPVCSSHASSLGGRGSSGFWVRPALSEKVSFSSYLPERVRASYGLEGSLPNGPLEGSPPDRLPRAQRLLSRLPRPAPPRPEFGEGSRGAEPVCRPAVAAEPCGSGCVVVAGERAPCTPPRARYFPPLLRAAVRDGVWVGDGGLPGPHPSSRASPVPSVACVPLARVHDFGRSRDAGLRRAWCVLCASRAVWLCRLAPPFPRQRSHGWRNRGSPPSPPRGREGPCLALIDLALGDGTVLWENGCWPRPARRRTWGPTAARGSSSVGIGVSASVSLSCRCRLLGLPGGRRVSGRLGAAGVVGLLRGVVQCDSRRFCLACPDRSDARAVSRSLVRTPFREGPVSAALAVVAGPRSAVSFPPPRSPQPVFFFSLPPSPLTDPWPCCRTPRMGGGRARTRPGGHRGLGGGPRGKKVGSAGGRSCGLEGVPAPRPWRCLARSWRGLRARGKGCPARAKGKRLAVVIVPTVWWSVGRGASGGLVRPCRPSGRRVLGPAGVPRWVPWRWD